MEELKIEKVKEDWLAVGLALEKMCDEGLFPAIAYDNHGWESWVYTDPPIQGRLGRHIKVIAETATEAVRMLEIKLQSRNSK